jgi:MFS family permease
MMSDYATRNVISPLFPMIKAEYMLSDTQLGMLVSAVTLAVGFSTIPLALIADRFGRVKAVTIMAVVWCLATMYIGISRNFEQMLVARFIVGLGEGAYAAAGFALLANAFPPRKHSSIMGAFQSAVMVGSTLGVLIGGILAVKYGWRTTFILVGAPGLLFAILFPLVVRDYKTVPLSGNNQTGERDTAMRRAGMIIREVFGSRSVNLTYFAYALQMAIPITLITWMPTYFNRYFGMDIKKAGLMGAALVVLTAVGMILGGTFSDRLSRKDMRYRGWSAAAYTALTGVLLIVACALPPSSLVLVLIFGGALFAAAHSGAASAILLSTTNPAVRTTVGATCITASALIGQSVGPVLVGFISDIIGLKAALTLIPFITFVPAILFILVSRTVVADMAKYAQEETPGEKAIS